MKLPKVLFLADEIPQSKNAGSIQFLRIFKDYPQDRLLVVGRKPDSDAVTLPCRYVELVFKMRDRIRVSRFNRFLADAEAMKVLSYRLPKSIQKEVDDFNPDLVITLMQLFMYYQTAYHYAVSNKKPLVVFCHDDVEAFSRVHEKLKGRLVKVNAAIYQYAKLRFCISPEMVKAWEEKYGASGEVMYPVPGEDIAPRSIEETKRLKVPGRLTLGFAGSMAYGYAEGMKELIPALEKSDTYLRIYNSPTSTLPKSSSKHIDFCGYAATPNETWERIKEECDAVILPYSFTLHFKDLYSTHFPSKLPEYLSLGMPVIVIGPEYATGVRWGLQNQSMVILIKGNEISDIVKVFLSAVKNPNWMVRISEQSIIARQRYFDPNNAISEFHKKLSFS